MATLCSISAWKWKSKWLDVCLMDFSSPSKTRNRFVSIDHFAAQRMRKCTLFPSISSSVVQFYTFWSFSGFRVLRSCWIVRNYAMTECLRGRKGRWDANGAICFQESSLEWKRRIKSGSRRQTKHSTGFLMTNDCIRSFCCHNMLLQGNTMLWNPYKVKWVHNCTRSDGRSIWELFILFHWWIWRCILTITNSECVFLMRYFFIVMQMVW